MTDLITRALRNATDTRAVVIGEEAVERTGEVFTELFGAARAIVVADERTFTLAGKRVSEALEAAGVELTDPHVFPGEPELYAKYENCEALRDILAPLDLTVMAAAPQVMTASGYGDLLGKIPAGADWILSDVLGIEAIDQGVWELVQGPLRGAVSRPAELAVGDVSATGELVEGLLMSGLAMQAHQSSRPASGAEHQFSHLWEMEGHGVDITPRRLSHGFKVGIGTVAIAALYERLLARDLTGLDIDAAVAAWPTREEMETGVRELHPDPRLVEETVVQALAKWLPPERLRVRLELLVAVWPELSVRLREQLLPAAELQGMLRAVGAPAHPQDIGLGWGRFRETYVRAQMIRKRYTVLDLALETNLLGELVEELFAPDGFWGRQAPGH